MVVGNNRMLALVDQELVTYLFTKLPRLFNNSELFLVIRSAHWKALS